MQEVKDGLYPQDNNVVVNAPHPFHLVCGEKWDKVCDGMGVKTVQLGCLVFLPH
jgi:hypothetical protein